jgi:hypothetical protein
VPSDHCIVTQEITLTALQLTPPFSIGINIDIITTMSVQEFEEELGVEI